MVTAQGEKRMTTYQEINAAARSTPDDIKFGTPPRPTLQAVGVAASPAVMMAAWM